MGAEGGLCRHVLPFPLRNTDGESPPPSPVIIGLQPVALVDHVARVDSSLLDKIPGDRGGSQQVTAEELRHILNEVNSHILPFPNEIPSLVTIAGGSVTNTIRGTAVGFGISSGIIAACGDDDGGSQFIRSMSFSGVDISRLRVKKGATGQCACLVDADGNRTMRPCLSSAVKIQACELHAEDLRGAKWLVLRYAFMNLEQIKAAILIAKQEGVSVSMDLASFEMVRDYKPHLIDLLETGNIDLCFANEDEATELISGETKVDPEAALCFLAKHCKWAVVTLGSQGCIAKHGNEVVRVEAIGDTQAIDATGAGDLFASGFLYGLVKGLPLEDCCKVGCCTGGSVVRSLGGEVRPENWQWMYKQMQEKGLLLPDLKN